MNIFVVDEDPVIAGQCLCDAHVLKLIVESCQTVCSALYINGAVEDQMPLTKSGSFWRGGYKHHPCTIWVSESRSNARWVIDHAKELLNQYKLRYGKDTHACEEPLARFESMLHMIPEKGLTPFVLAMDDEHKQEDAVLAYRSYYRQKATNDWFGYNKGTTPPEWLFV
tara:strand:+ start:1140 stop:1643 length:504 start_codon:yes stop_codon:yes gene_type:complete